jgi:chromosome segregation ATPase
MSKKTHIIYLSLITLGIIYIITFTSFYISENDNLIREYNKKQETINLLNRELSETKNIAEIKLNETIKEYEFELKFCEYDIKIKESENKKIVQAYTDLIDECNSKIDKCNSAIKECNNQIQTIQEINKKDKLNNFLKAVGTLLPFMLG